MKCIQCGSEWSVPDKLKSNIVKCPFCNADLNKNEPKEIVDVLIEWGNKEGIEFFEKSMKINGLLADFFPNKGRERNAIKIALEKGMGSQIVQLHYEDYESIKLIRINQMKRILLEDAWLSESAADFVMSTLITASDAVGGKIRENTYSQVTVKVQEPKETPQMKTNVSQTPIPPQRGVKDSDKKSEKSIQDQITELMESGKKYEAAGEFKTALVVYNKAVAIGSAEAAYHIAEIFSQNLVEFNVLYVGNVLHGTIPVQGNADCGRFTIHAMKNERYKKVIYYFEQFALGGNRNAQYNLASCYEHGRWVPKNRKKAFEWYTRAAEQGHSEAQYSLGHMYECMYEHGEGTDEDLKKALYWYEKSAENGNRNAQNVLASCYYYGTGVPVNYKKAFEWYTRAAGQGNSEAQNSLGYMYEHGEGVGEDLKKALYWYEKSAENGNRNAQNNLAFFYYSGTSVSVNYKKAFEWYKKAANQGHSGAQNNLGVMYEYGYEVEKSLTEAVKWYKKASENGNEDGRDNYERCRKLVGTKG